MKIFKEAIHGIDTAESSTKILHNLKHPIPPTRNRRARRRAVVDDAHNPGKAINESLK